MLLEVQSPIQEQVKNEEKQQPSSSLLLEAKYLHNNYGREGLPANWRLLDKTGFSITSQIDLLYESQLLNTEESEEQVIQTWLDQTEEDTKGFIIEYLTQKLTFPIYLKTGVVNNERTIIAPKYGGKRMVDLVLEQERRGSVKYSLEKKIEPFLLDAPEGSIAVLTSPEGWSGLKTDMKNGVGDDIIFPDSQTQIYQKKGEDIVGFTIRTDLSLDEHREVIKRLGGSPPQTEDVCEFVLETCFVDGNENPDIEISDVVKLMQSSRKDTSLRLDAYKGRSWSEIYEDFQHSEALWKFDDVTRDIFQEYRDLVTSQSFTREELEEITAVMILRIARALGVDKDSKEKTQTPIVADFEATSHVTGVPILAYGALLSKVEERGGCAGGGSVQKTGLTTSMDAILTSLNPRFISFSRNNEDDSYSFDQPGPCKVCGEDVNCGPCQICKPCDQHIQREQAKKNVMIEGLESEISL